MTTEQIKLDIATRKPDEFCHGAGLSAALIEMLPIDDIFPHPDNPRKDLGDLSELAESIKANGIMQNLTVAPMIRTDNGEKGYQVIIGHRRLAAAKIAGLKYLPCFVAIGLKPEEQIAVMLTENIQRSALTPYEEAKGFEQLRIDFGKSAREIAEMSGFSETTVRNRLKLAKLDADKFNASIMRGGRLEDYLELDKIKNPDLKNQVLDEIGTNNFRNALKAAIKNEKTQSTLERWDKEASAFAMRIDHKADLSGKAFVHYWTAHGDQSVSVERPEDDGTSEYYYTIDFDTLALTLYRDRTKQDKTETAAREAKEQAIKAAYDAKKARFEEITERHKELRKEFAAAYLCKKDSAPVIMQYAADILIGDGRTTRFGNYFDIRLLLELLKRDDQFDAENGDWGDALRVIQEYIRDDIQNLRGANEQFLFWTLYADLDGWTQNGRYWGDHWDSDNRKWHISYQENPTLDRLYGLLTAVGYEMSEEEVQMRNGTHPLFRPEESGGEN